MEVVFANGRSVVIRPIRESDRDCLQRGSARLGEETRRQRFHHHRTAFSHAEISHLVSCNGIDHIAFVARGLDDKGEETDDIGVARAYRLPDASDVAEVAVVVVVDDWQGLGVGRHLLRCLVTQCRSVGIDFWIAEVLGDNEIAAKLFASFGDIVLRTWEGGAQRLTIDLKVLPFEKSMVAPTELN